MRQKVTQWSGVRKKGRGLSEEIWTMIQKQDRITEPGEVKEGGGVTRNEMAIVDWKV